MQIYESVKGLKKWQKIKGLMSLLGLFSFALILNTPAQASEFSPVLNRIKAASESYLILGAGNHTIYTSLSTTKGANYPDVVVLNGTIYYFKANEATLELTTAIRNLAATGANAVREVTSSDDYIFSVGGKYYTYFASQLPSSAWQASAGSPNDYNFAHKNGDTISYYNFGLKNNDRFTWTSGTAEAGPVYDELNNTITGTIKIVMPHTTVSGGVPTTTKEASFYTYTYNVPSTYSVVTSRFANNTTVVNKTAMGISSELQGGALYINTQKDEIIADFIGNSTSHGYGGGALAVSGSKAVYYIIGNFIGNSATVQNAGGANLGTSGKIGSVIGNFIGNTAKEQGGALYRKQGDTGSIVGSFISNSAKYGGAFFQNSANIGAMVGDFVANSATNEGGAIYTGGDGATAIYSLVGNFINNSAGTLGSAIYVHNAISDITITGDFTGNTAGSTDGGGAIYNKGKVTLNATDRDISFYNNKAASAYNDIYNTSSLTLNAYTDRYIDFSGSVKGSNGTIYINNDSVINGGDYIFNNEVSGNTVKIYRGANVKLGSATQTDFTQTYGVLNLTGFTNDANGGSIDMANNHVNSTNFGAMTLGSDLNLSIDAALATTEADYLAASSITANGHYLIINSINVISDAASSPISVAIANNTLRDYVKLTTDEMRVQGVDESVSYVVTYDKTSGTEGLLTFVTKAYLLPDAVADTKAERNYHMGGDEEMEADLGQMGGGTGASLTVNAGYGEDAHTVQGNQHGGIIVGDGQTLTINGGIWDNFKNAYQHTAATGNHARGGAIFNTNGTLNINSATFSNNFVSATVGTGAKFGYGGAIWNNGANMSISSSTFVSNSASTLGGAIRNSGANAQITDSTFISNSAGESGGAIYNQYIDETQTGTLTLNADQKDIIFTGNTANGKPNDIFNSNGAITIAGTHAVTMDGGIQSFGDDASLTINSGATLNLNIGQGTIQNGDSANTLGKLTLNNNMYLTLDASLAEATRGADYVSATSITRGGDYYLIINGINVLSDDDVTSPISIAVVNSTLKDYTKLTTDEMRVEGVGEGVSYIVTYDKSGTEGMLTFAAGGTYLLPDAVADTALERNYTMGANETMEADLGQMGGGSGASLTVNAGYGENAKTVQGNQHGGIIIGDGQNLTINGGVWDNFKNAYQYGDSQRGGAIYNIGGTLDINSATFSNNTTSVSSEETAYGGAIYSNNTNYYANYYISISNSDFISNRAIVNGSYSNAYGGAIYNRISNSANSYMTIASSNFIGNKAISNDIYAQADGGAIYNANTRITITDSTFVSNSASSRGGAIDNSGANMSVVSSTFVSNSASSGGAIWNNGANAQITDSDFISNSAGSLGGAIYNYTSGTLTLNADTKDITFSGNKANGKPNDIFNSNGAITIAGTHAVNMDGGIQSYGDNAALTIDSGATLNLNIGQGTIQNDTLANSLGKLTSNGNFNATIDMNLASGDVDTISSLAGSTGTITLTSLNILGSTDWDDINTDTTFQILLNATGNNNVMLALTSELAAELATYNKETVITPGSSYDDQIGAITYWNDVLYHHDISDFVSNKTVGLVTQNTTNDSLGVRVTTSGGVETKTVLTGDLLKKVVQATTPAERSFLAGDATNAYEVTEDLGQIGGITLIINGRNTADTNLTINGNAHAGIIVGDGQTLNINGGVWDNFKNAYQYTSGSTGQYGYAYGGAIFNSNGTLNVNSATFSNNFASATVGTGSKYGYGGAIYNSGANMSVANSDFVSNSAKNNGGAIYNNGGVYLSVDSSQFVSNSTQSFGGAIYNTGSDTQITDSTFVSNSAFYDGGAIWNSGAYMSVTNSKFISNESQNTDGGAISNEGAYLSVASSLFISNEVLNYGGAIYNTGAYMSIANSDFVSNSVLSTITYDDVYGGAIYNRGAYMSIANSKFVSNFADNPDVVNYTYGGAIYNTGAYASITNSDFIANNSGKIRGVGPAGAIYNTGDNLAIASSNFASNIANTSGGAIYNTGANLAIASSHFASNQATYGMGGAIYNSGANLNIASSEFLNNYSYYGGGAVYNTTANAQITNSDFISNASRNYNGGAIHNLGENLNVVSSNFISNNSGSWYGGAIYNSGNEATIAHSIFVSNYSNYYTGGAIYNAGHNSHLDNNTFVSNRGGRGATIYNSGNNLQISNSHFVSNVADYSGGAIYNNGGSKMSITNTEFVSNSDGGQGGAAIYNNGGAYLSVASSQFVSNSSEFAGAAIYNYNAPNLSITNSDFISNIATSDMGYGAIYNYNSDNLNIVSSNFVANSTNGYGGGAVYNKGANMSIASSNFVDNSIRDAGGAVYNGGYDASISSSIFVSNSAENSGGAITNNYSSANMSIANSDFISNVANYGGAVSNMGATTTITDANFISNIAVKEATSGNVYSNGGAINNGGANMTITNSNFISNSVTGKTSGGNVYAYGGAIDNGGAIMSIASSTFVKNTAFYGGAIRNTGAYMSVASSRFVSNSANNFGGAIYNTGAYMSVASSGFVSNSANIYGGAIYNAGAYMSVASSRFVSNSANNYGGAIYNTGAYMSVASSTFTSNTANYIGGAIYNEGAYMSVANSKFVSNSATADGGAIFNTGDNASINNSTFVSNSAGNQGGSAIRNTGANMTVNNTYFVSNLISSGMAGAGIQNTGDYLSVDNSHFISNFTSTGTWGGAAIYNTGVGAKISNSEFVSNWTLGSAGAVLNAGGDMTITDSKFVANYMPNNGAGGAAITNNSGTMTIKDSLFVSNRTDNASGGAALSYGSYMSVVNSQFVDNSATGNGGAIANQGNTLVITDSDFVSNSANFVGGAVYGNVSLVKDSNFVDNINSASSGSSNGGAIYTYNAEKSITASKFTNNKSFSSTGTALGGAIVNTGAYMSITNSDFTSNQAITSSTNTSQFALGGAISNFGAYMSVANSNFISNRADSTTGRNTYGGAIYNAGDYMSVANSRFVSNLSKGTSVSYAGAIYNTGANAEIIGSDFVSNSADSSGGAIYNTGAYISVASSKLIANESINPGGAIFNTGAYMSVANSTFVSNQANGAGGAIDNTGKNMSISSSDFVSNSAAIGGAIENSGDNMSVANSTFVSNSANNYGGAIYNAGDYMSVANSKFVSNSADSSGGAIYNTGAYISVASSTFVSNKANSYGGAISNFGTYMSVASSKFIANSASSLGGSIFNTGNGLQIASSDFISNKSTNNGGGAIFNAGDYMSVANSTFASNSAQYGGAISNYGAYMSIANSTFVSNSANNYGGAIYNTGANAQITDSDFISNSVDASGGAIYNQYYSTSQTGSLTLNADTKDIIFSGNTANGKPNDIFNSNGAITIAGTHAVNMDGGIQSYGDNATLTINSGATLNLNIGQGTIQNDTLANSLGKLTSNGNFNATIDMNLASGDVDTISSLAGSTGTITLTSLNILGGNWNNINTDTTFQILLNATGNNNVTLALTSELAAELATYNKETVITPGSSYDDQIGATTYWNDVLYHHDISDFVSNKTVGLVTQNTTNDSLGVRISSSGGVDTKTVLTGDLLKKVVQAATPAERNFLAGDATNAYEVTEDLGQMGGTTLTINGKNNTDTDLTINGNAHAGIIVGEGQTLNINNVILDGFKNAYQYTSGSTGQYGYAYGGAIFNSNGTLNVNSATFSNNFASATVGTGSKYGYGGAIYNSGANMSVANSDFVSNSANNYGGAIYNRNGANMSIANSGFISNSAKDSGGAISNYGAYMSIASSTFVSNKADNYYGGAIYNYDGANMSVASSTFVSNSANNSGGAIYNTGFGMNINRTQFVSNKANNSGGAISNYGAYMSIADSTFVSNSAYTSGGAIYNSGAYLSIADSTFVSNSSKGNYGGVIYNGGDYTSITNSTFVSNYATSSTTYGGAIYNNSSAYMSIANSTFVSNSAGRGGAIDDSKGAYTSIASSTFVSNTAKYNGGAINSDRSIYMSIASSIFVANSSSNGGAIYNDQNSNYASIANSTFVSNSANNSGGAINNYYGKNMSISSSIFVSNSANYSGGAIYIYRANDASITNSAFVSNSATYSGGAINSWGSTNMNIATSDFVSNKSNQSGGALFNVSTNVMITDSTFVSNSADADGGAIYNRYVDTASTGTLTLNADTKDINFVGNKANGTPNDIFNSNGAITITGTHAVTMDGGIQSYGDDATLTINSGATLNLNIGQGTLQNDSLGILTNNSNFNATIDMNLAATGAVDTISSLAGSTGTITLTSLNILGGDWDDINTDTTFQILLNATGNNNVTLALTSELAAELATYNKETVITPGSSYDDQIGAITYWNDVLYHHDISDFVSNKTVGLVTQNTTNDSLGVRISSSGGVETKTVLTGDLLKKVVQATTPAERSFLAGDATNAYEVTEDLGQMGGITLTINGRNTADTNLTINGNAHAGIIVGEGQTLNINGGVWNNFKNAYQYTSGSTGQYGYAYGGAIFNSNGTLNVNSATFSNNFASATVGTGSKYGYGGAIYNSGAYTSVANSDFVSNSANNYGGAIYNRNGANMSIANSGFISNSAKDSGGAIYNTGSDTQITDSTFVSNTAGSGGAIYNTGAYLSIANSDFVKNSAQYGGAISNEGAYLSVASSLFVSNEVLNYGSAIYNTGAYMSVASSDFVKNAAFYGGAIDNGGAIMSIASSTFVKNTARYQGGAIYNAGAYLSIANSDFVSNSVLSTVTYDEVYGGAIYNRGAYMSIASSTFASNSASGSGGAVYNTGSNMSIASSTFVSNSSTGTYGYGGAIYNTGTGATITDSTFVSNSANSQGGAIYNKYSSTSATGTLTINADTKDIVLSGNKANGKPNDIFNSNGAITIAGSHAVTMDGGIQSYGDDATLTINSGATLNLNIGQGIIQEDSLGIVTINENGNFYATVDMNLTTGSNDTILSLDNSTGTIILTDLNILDGAWTDVAATTKFQILKNATDNNNLQLDLVDSLKEKTVIDTEDEKIDVEEIVTDTAWNKIYKTTTTTASTTYGQIILATKDTTNDSLAYKKTKEGGEVIVTSQGNTLALVNSSTLTTRNFNANEDGAAYTLDDDVDLGTTTAGTFNINGIADGDEETLDLNGVDSFKLANETTLNFNNVTVTSSDNIADVTNSSATIGLDSATVDGNITADAAYNLVTRGSSVLKGTVEKANLTIDSGELTTTAENIADVNSVTNNATLNLSGGLAQIINGTSGTTKVNSSLGLNSGAEIKGTLDINDGEITVSDGEITSHNIGAITGNGFMTIDVNLTNQTADKLTIANNSDASITLNPVNIIDDVDELDKNFNVKILDTTSDAKLVATDDTFSDKEYLIDTVNGKTVEDEINAVTKWNEEYQKHITADEFIYGKLGLDDTNTSIKVSESSRSGGGTTDVTMGDTLALVTKDETNPTKIFIANNDGDNYDLEGGLSELKGNLTISGIEGNEEEVIDLNNHNGFEINDSNASLTLKDVTLTNANGNVVANSAGTLTGTNTKINGNISNQSSAKFTDSKVNGNIENEGNIDLTDTDINGAIVNDGTLEVNKNVKLGTVIGSGTTNINADIDLINSINGNTVNVKNATLTGAQKLGTDVTLNTFGSTLELGTNTVNVKSLTLDENSKLTLRINGFAEGQYGQLNALENITIIKGAKLAATITQGIGTGDITLLKAPTHTGDFDDADVTHTEEGIEIADNNMYKFEKKAGQFGVFTISKKATAEELVLKDGGEKWVAKAAGAWVDGPEFKDNTPARDVADKLVYLTQHDIKGLQRNLKALAPTENTIVQINSTEEASRLFRTVDGHLRGTRYPLGISSGDTPQGVSIWAKAYVGEAKIDTRGRTAGSNADSRGLIMGIEKKLDKTKKIGAGFHYDSTDVDALSRNIEVDSTAGFIYAEYKPTRWFINGIASYGQSNYHEKKHALDTTYDATYDVHMTSLAAMTGYQFKHVTPEAGLRYYHIKQDGYTDSAEQTVKSSNTDILRAVAGVRYARGICNVRPEIYAGLTYDVMTDRNNTMVNLTNGTTYTVPGRRLPRLGYETEVGASIILRDGLIASVSYQGAYRKDYQEHSGMVNLKYEF